VSVKTEGRTIGHASNQEGHITVFEVSLVSSSLPLVSHNCDFLLGNPEADTLMLRMAGEYSEAEGFFLRSDLVGQGCLIDLWGEAWRLCDDAGMNACYERWAFSCVSQGEDETERESVGVMPTDIVIRINADVQPRALARDQSLPAQLVGFRGSPGLSGGVDESGAEKKRTKYAESDLPSRKPEQGFGGLSHALLSGKIVLRALLLTLLGVLFAVPSAWAVVLILDRGRRWDWLRGLALIALSAPITGAFHSWAALGHPLWVWRAYTGW
jgi:hypothetical protein